MKAAVVFLGVIALALMACSTKSSRYASDLPSVSPATTSVRLPTQKPSAETDTNAMPILGVGDYKGRYESPTGSKKENVLLRVQAGNKCVYTLELQAWKTYGYNQPMQCTLKRDGNDILAVAEDGSMLILTDAGGGVFNGKVKNGWPENKITGLKKR